MGGSLDAPAKAYLVREFHSVDPEAPSNAAYLPAAQAKLPFSKSHAADSLADVSGSIVKQKMAVLSEYLSSLDATSSHQTLLHYYNIGQRLPERDRIRVNAGRVGLKVPAFPDEKPLSVPI